MDNLQYIRDAVRQHGNRVQVKVIRWQINPATGAQDSPYEVSVNGQIALKELSKPINKRSFSWNRIRPIGDLFIGKVNNPTDQNSLSNPELLSKLKEELKAQVRAELEAELAAEADEKPKRKKKAIEESGDEPTLDGAALFESFTEQPQL